MLAIIVAASGRLPWPPVITATIMTAFLLLPATAETTQMIPAEFQGTWGSNCERPQMKLDAMVVHDLSNQARGPVIKVVRDGDQLVIHYSLKLADGFKDVADTFQIEGPTATAPDQIRLR
jgi:hypothetical protein